MPELEERLKNLVSDDERMQQILAIAAALSGQKGETASSVNENEKGHGDEEAAPAMFTEAASSDANASDASLYGSSKIAEVMPVLMQALSGEGNFVKSDKLNLVKAMRPYISVERGINMERAIKMANMAKAAKIALGILGS